jgi:hypothetical protein
VHLVSCKKMSHEDWYGSRERIMKMKDLLVVGELNIS